MEKLHKQPDVSRQDYYAFVNELRLFHQNKGTPFRHVPKINGREIDLHKLYNHVTALGGLRKVTELQKWDSIAEVLKLPKACVNFALSLRLLYIRYLSRYEQIHFLGEGLDHDKTHSSESQSKTLQPTFLHHVPMFYNAAQHELTNSTRAAAGLNQKFVSFTDYDKLCKSLLCGLPNEQELALNVCTILSNEGNYMLHLEHAPKLVDLLVAQAGIWSLYDDSLKNLYLESWKDLKGRDVNRFWRNSLDFKSTHIVQLLGLDIADPDPDSILLNLESDLGILNTEGQRVLRIALIFHNLSFESNNVPVLVQNENFIRFILLSSHSSWANLKCTAYDTLSNVAFQMKLCIEKDICSRVLFQTVMDGILSPDRYMNIRSMDILAQLCTFEPNEDIIPSRVDFEVYQKMVSFLTIHDVMLLFYTLEALYSLSDLGRYACDKIVSVYRCVGTLVSLLTLDPSQYGPLGHIKMKIVETLVPVETDSQMKKTASISTSDCATPGPPVASNHEVDPEPFVCSWLKSNYEMAHGFMVPRNDLFSEYVSFCNKSGRKSIINANIFAACVKSCFPQCGLRKVESGTGIISFHHDGIRKRSLFSMQSTPHKPLNVSQNSRKVPATPVSCRPQQRLTYSPILKAQLSAPPRSGVTSPPPKRTQQILMNGLKSSTVNSPNLLATPTSGSSTLIKSLLANKVQQRNVQRQVVPQKVSKMLIYSPDKVSPNTIVRCVRPGVSVNIRTPLQARFVTSKGQFITTNKSQLIKTAAAVSSALLNKRLPKQSVMVASATTPRINGVQKGLRMDVYPQDEDSKSSEDVPFTSFPKFNSSLNHINSNSSFDTKDSFSCDGDSLLSSKDSEITSDSDRNFEFSQVSENRNLTVSNEHTNPVNISDVESLDNVISCKEHNHIPGLVNDVNSNKTSEKGNTLSSATSLLKSMLNDISTDNEIMKRESLLKDKICKKAPLLNGLLDKGSVSFPKDCLSNTLHNGDSSQTSLNSNNEESITSSSSVQSNFSLGVTSSPLLSNSAIVNSVSTSNSFTTSSHNSVTLSSEPVVTLAPSTNEHHYTSAPSSNSVNTPETNFNSLAEKNSTSNVISSSNSAQNSALSSESSIPVVIPSVESPPTHANGESLMKICSQPTTLSATIELQDESEGVVRLHIESPENSNQGSDLSSISDIAKTLECASQAISRTNAECNSQVPLDACETTATVTVITTNTPSLSRTGQQPAINQPQLHIQSPNIKFRIVHSQSRTEDSGTPSTVVQISIPETESDNKMSVKRPSSENDSIPPDSKRSRSDTQTPLLEASLQIPSSASSGTNVQDTHTFCLKSSQVAAVKAVPVQNADLPNEKEDKTFSGLSSASDNPSLSSPSSEPKSTTNKEEYICEWKDCGLKFSNPDTVFHHASKTHTPDSNDDMLCKWEGCDSLKRKRFSLLTHLQDWHCNERALHIQSLRRKQLSQHGKSTISPPQMPHPHPGYAPDAALLAIRRHALQYVNPKELSEEKEGALARSIRLTAALILRNLATHSSLARTYVRRFEPELAYLAMSQVESARTLAQCLSYLSTPQD